MQCRLPALVGFAGQSQASIKIIKTTNRLWSRKESAACCLLQAPATQPVLHTFVSVRVYLISIRLTQMSGSCNAQALARREYSDQCQ